MKIDLEQHKRRWHNHEVIEEQIKQIVSEDLGIGTEMLTGSSLWYSPENDLSCVETILAFEEAFGIEIPDEDVEQLPTIKQMTDYILEKLHGPSAERNS